LARLASIASARAEFDDQPSLLCSLSGRRLEEAEEGSVFVGAGDSYAAALCAFFMSPRRVQAFDPYSLSRSPHWARGRTVYIISVSGATRSNVELAASLRSLAGRVVAVTSYPSSPLAEEADDVVEMPFRPLPKSPGIATFTLSLLIALKLSCGKVRCDFRRAASTARPLARSVAIARGGVTHLVGNNEAYAASVYGAAKIYELLGGRAQASLLEEFSHMQLFSLAPSDRVNVAGPSTEALARRLRDALRENGVGCSLVGLSGPRVERLFAFVFSLQLAAVEEAAARGLRNPYFLSARKKLRISDRMIY
jgi:fructoselysine-6-P-deglycase FrlB-like protein